MKKVIFIIPILIICLGTAFYIFNNNEFSAIDNTKSNSKIESDQFVVQISENDITERDIIELIGVNSLLNIKEGYYQLLLNSNQYETIIEENILHVKVPLALPSLVEGMSIYSITIKEPVINSKVQELANYGSIIENISKNKYTIWTNASNLEEINKLDFIQETAAYHLHERMEPNLIAKSESNEKVTVVMKVVLPNDNTLDKIMSEVVKQGGENVTQYKSDIISKSLDSLNLEIIIPANKLYKLLLSNPEIVIIRGF